MEIYIEKHPNGLVKNLGYKTNSKKEGTWYQFTEGGKVFIETNYINDEETGVFRRWHENGLLAIETYYDKGKPEGILKEYYENGSLKEEGLYTNAEYSPNNFWDENGEQTLKNGTGYKIEGYGAGPYDIYKQFYENRKFTREEKIKGVVFGRFIPDTEG